MAAGAGVGVGAVAGTVAIDSDVAAVDAVVLIVGAVGSPGDARIRGAAGGVDAIAMGAGAGAVTPSLCPSPIVIDSRPGGRGLTSYKLELLFVI